MRGSGRAIFSRTGVPICIIRLWAYCLLLSIPLNLCCDYALYKLVAVACLDLLVLQ
jgi:hypothetical protein